MTQTTMIRPTLYHLARDYFGSQSPTAAVILEREGVPTDLTDLDKWLRTTLLAYVKDNRYWFSIGPNNRVYVNSVQVTSGQGGYYWAVSFWSAVGPKQGPFLTQGEALVEGEAFLASQGWAKDLSIGAGVEYTKPTGRRQSEDRVHRAWKPIQTTMTKTELYKLAQQYLHTGHRPCNRTQQMQKALRNAGVPTKPHALQEWLDKTWRELKQEDRYWFKGGTTHIENRHEHDLPTIGTWACQIDTNKVMVSHKPDGYYWNDQTQHGGPFETEEAAFADGYEYLRGNGWTQNLGAAEEKARYDCENAARRKIGN